MEECAPKTLTLGWIFTTLVAYYFSYWGFVMAVTTLEEFLKDTKRTTVNVNPTLHKALRIKLLAENRTFTRWIQEKMYEEVFIFGAGDEPEIDDAGLVEYDEKALPVGEIEVDYDIVEDE